MVEHLVGLAIIYHNPMRYYRSDYQKQTATVGAPLYERKIAFFVSIAHDIRTPLTLVKAPLDELRQDSTLHADAIRSIGLAHSNLNKLLDILSQLLDLNE